ncbi:UbiA family prenyltransferase [Nocardia wallacei]|uniref:UbiA family prenyltransferase n=1 Tax=Nocardia wallacei TaxID=480035 RepID=UPI0024544557|nr:UbiA family prenyltransferase [Nocardia wallacei]
MLQQVGKFARLSLLGGTLFYVALGAVSAKDQDITGGIILLEISVATLFHIHAYVVNDIFDLELDRTEPRRMDFPLVTGALSVTSAWIIALTALAGSFLVTLAELSPTSALFLVGAYSGLTIYNIAGKKAAVPILTDFVQGCGWASLVLFGATAAGYISRYSLMVAAYVCIYVVFMSVHGGLRDIDNDYRRCAQTTPIFFGARPISGTIGFVTGNLLAMYVSVLQLSLVLLGVAAPLFSLPMAAPGTLLRLAVATAIFTLSSLMLLRAFRAGTDFAVSRTAGAGHLVLTLYGGVFVALPEVGFTALIVLAAVLVLPTLGNTWFRRAFALPYRLSAKGHTGRPR